MSLPETEQYLTGAEAAAALEFASVHLHDMLFMLGTTCSLVSVAPEWLTIAFDTQPTAGHLDQLPDSFEPAPGKECGVLYIFGNNHSKQVEMFIQPELTADTLSTSPEQLLDAAAFLAGRGSMQLSRVTVTYDGLSVIEEPQGKLSLLNFQ
jgi:hypothetical protein